MSQFEVRIHGRSPDGMRIVHVSRGPALDLADASRRARARAVAAGVRLPLVFAVLRLPSGGFT